MKHKILTITAGDVRRADNSFDGKSCALFQAAKRIIPGTYSVGEITIFGNRNLDGIAKLRVKPYNGYGIKKFNRDKRRAEYLPNWFPLRIYLLKYA